LVADYFIDSHPAILRLISLIVDESGDRRVSLCGEVAARIQALPLLLETGVRSFSVSAALVPDVKNAIRLMVP
jgi:phosphotransferase system enzyme I (PtsI)